MASMRLALALALLLVGSQALFNIATPVPNDFNPNIKYYFAGMMQPDFAYDLDGSTDNSWGSYLITLEGNTLTYKLTYSFTEDILAIGVYGPRRVVSDPNLPFTTVVAQNAAVMYTLDDAPLIKQLKVFPGSTSGSFSLSSDEVAMLYSQSLYIRIDTELRPKGALAGAILRLDYDRNGMAFVVEMGGSNGKDFPGSSKESSGTSTTGIGLVYQTALATSPNSWNFLIYHTAVNAGNLVLRCNDGAPAAIKNNANSPIAAPNINLAASTTMQLYMEENCYIYLTTAKFPNGELFGFLRAQSPFGIQLSGNQMRPSVSTSSAAVANLWADRSLRWLYGNMITNITTADITNIRLYVGSSKTSEGDMVCQLYPSMTTINAGYVFPAIGCRFNQSYWEDIWEGNTYVVISTTSHTEGELRGQQVVTSSAKSSNSNVGMAIGITIGVLALVALIVGLSFFAYKKGAFKNINMNFFKSGSNKV